MAPRLELQALLKSILGSSNVYFQQPSTVTMKYPCFVYSFDQESKQHADNRPYTYMRRYMVTYIDSNPDSAIPDQLAMLPLCELSRTYSADNLHHYAYNLYF